MKWIAGVVALLFLGAGILSIPVWKKNSFTIKQKEKRELLKKKAQLLQANLILDRQINSLAHVGRIETIASQSLGLTWGERPIEVEVE